MAIVDVDKVSEFIVEAADKFIVPRYKTLENHEILTKTSPTDLVTQADLDAEVFLEGILSDLHPDSIVLGEESVSQGVKSLDLLQNSTGMIWVLDPVDGTSNFVRGNDCFGVMVACILDGVTQHSWIYDVPRRTMSVSERGQGAYSYAVDVGAGQTRTRLRVCDVPPEEMVGHINYKFFPEAIRPSIVESAQNLGVATPLGSAAHEYTRIAQGQSHCAVYSRLKPWDHLPGALLVQEAGGYVAKWDRAPYTPKDDYAGLIVTSSKDRWEELYRVFFDGLDLERYL